ncbi:MAG TPA: hypothetical protein VGE00_08945 [Gammaproteobacteria bacterium]
MKRILASAVLATVSMGAQAASDIDALQDLANTYGQEGFRLLSEDLGAALSYKALAPAEPLGITGFDIGIEMTATQLEHSKLFDAVTTGSNFDSLPVAKLHVHKGLPFNIDVGAFLSEVPDSNIKLTGAELRYAFLEGGVAMPALALRGTYTKLSGVDELDLSTRGLELTISKGLAMFTPYAGVGKVWTTSTPNLPDTAPVQLEEEKFSQNKMLVGANLNMGLMNLAVEGDKTGDATTYGLKLGLRW